MEGGKMKRILSAIAIVLFVLSLNACSNGTTKPTEIDTSKLRKQAGLYYEKGKSEPFTGKAVSYYPNLKKKKDTNYIDGKEDGLQVRWYMEGQKKVEGNWTEGKKDGLWVEYHENGKKKTEGNYEDGKQEGLWKAWDENGEKTYHGYHEDGKSR